MYLTVYFLSTDYATFNCISRFYAGNKYVVPNEINIVKFLHMVAA